MRDDDGGGAVRVTLKDIYAQLIDVSKAVESLLTAAETDRARRDDHEARLRTIESHGTDSHERRISDLERFRWAYPATLATSLTTAVAAVAVAVLR